MGTQVTCVYTVTPTGVAVVTIQPLILAAPIPPDVLDAFGLRIISDLTPVATPVVRTIVLGFDPSTAAAALPPVISNTSRIESLAVDPAFPGVNYILPPGIAISQNFRTENRATNQEAILQAFMAATSVDVPTTGAGYTAATTKAHFLGGLPPAPFRFTAGCVRYVNIKNRGRGYPVGSTVVFSGGGPAGGPPAIPAQASLVLNAQGRVQSITMIDMGSGYNQVPNVIIVVPLGTASPIEPGEFFAVMAEGRPAKGTVTVGGAPFPVTGVTITDRGDNYVSVPDIVIIDTGGGIGATARARMGVGRIDVINPGQGYLVGTTMTFIPAFQELFPVDPNDPQAQATMFFRFLEAQIGVTASTPVDSTTPLVA